LKEISSIGGYAYEGSSCGHEHAYLLPKVYEVLDGFFDRHPHLDRRVFDLGCGNGAVANQLALRGYSVSGVDPSREGIRSANEAFPHLPLQLGSAYDALVAKFGTFPAVISLEVVEHVYAPRDYARQLFELVQPGGLAVISTPYHGYIKNVALAVSGKLDNHFTALWDHGHIKFWSMRTLGQLLVEAGFTRTNYYLGGRFAPLPKSMIAVAHKP
jgi:SAM-dependent methyltransferase